MTLSNLRVLLWQFPNSSEIYSSFESCTKQSNTSISPRWGLLKPHLLHCCLKKIDSPDASFGECENIDLKNLCSKEAATLLDEKWSNIQFNVEIRTSNLKKDFNSDFPYRVDEMNFFQMLKYMKFSEWPFNEVIWVKMREK